MALLLRPFFDNVCTEPRPELLTLRAARSTVPPIVADDWAEATPANAPRTARAMRDLFIEAIS